jgi:glucose-6-phosphate-specific signal transduction histidine kinase
MLSRVKGLGCKVMVSKSRVSGFGAKGLRFRVSSLGLRL